MDVDISGVVSTDWRGYNLFSYIGSKKKYINKILSVLPPHDKYVEPFGGSASVLLNKPVVGFEVLNDYSRDVYSVYYALVNEYEAFIDYYRNVLYCESTYEVFIDWLFGCGEEVSVKRAVAYIYCLSASYGTLPYWHRAAFRKSKSVVSRYAYNWSQRIGFFSGMCDRLRGVVLCNLDIFDLIDRYDSEEVLFYFDPPYREVLGEGYYKAGDFDEGVYDRFIDRIDKGLRGSFILSEYDLHLDKGWEVFSFKANQKINNSQERREYLYRKLNGYHADLNAMYGVI